MLFFSLLIFLYNDVICKQLCKKNVGSYIGVVDDVHFVAFGFLFVLLLYRLHEKLFLMQLSECVRFFCFFGDELVFCVWFVEKQNQLLPSYLS